MHDAARGRFESAVVGEFTPYSFTDSRMPRGWREEEDSDEADARWHRWQASDGETEAEGDEPWQIDEDNGSSADEGGEGGGRGQRQRQRRGRR